ncbi:MAG: InlB B-repeat-containing protein [Actinomycetes bacterium]
MSCTSSCSAPFTSGTTVTLTATPNTGATLALWSGCDSVAGNTCTLTMSTSRSVTATFSYPLTVTASSGGTITSSPTGISCPASCTASYAAGTTVTLTATPSPGATFTGWVGCDSVSATTCFVTLNSARSVSASFAGP